MGFPVDCILGSSFVIFVKISGFNIENTDFFNIENKSI